MRITALLVMFCAILLLACSSFVDEDIEEFRYNDYEQCNPVIIFIEPSPQQQPNESPGANEEYHLQYEEYEDYGEA